MEELKNTPIKIRPEVAAIPPYKQGMAPSKPGFKLSSNENPFAPLPEVVQAADATTINRYAGVAMPELRAKIGAKFGLSPEDSQDQVHLGAGSVSILYQLIQAVVGVGDNYVYAWPSFEGYPLLGIASGAQGIPIDLTKKFKHDLKAMAKAVNEDTRAVILCSPNNPTGPTISAKKFHKFMQSIPSDVLVILDEAYFEFVTDPKAVNGAEVLPQYANVVVLRTFSKAYGLAGLRIGYGVGNAAIWDAAKVAAIPLSVTGQAEAAALASLEPKNEELLQQRIAELVARKEELVAGLRDLGYEVPEAQGNFVWLPLGDDSVPFANAFLEEGTLLRPFAGVGVRITVGEAESIPEVLRIAAKFKKENVNN